MAIKNYTTTIDAEKTISEINKILSRHNVDKIMMDYEDGMAIGLTFRCVSKNQEMSFQLPCRWRSTLLVLEKTAPKKFQTKEQAIRVSWRIIKDWIHSQMALVEIEMVDVMEVFLPYAITQGGKTVYERLQEGDFKMLGE